MSAKLQWKSNKPKPMTVLVILAGVVLFEGTFKKAEAYRNHLRKGGRGG